MGYMTTLTFLNDAWSDIENEPQRFVENINLGMNRINRHGQHSNYMINNYGRGVQVAYSHYTDIPRLYFVHENRMNIIGYENDITNIELRKNNLQLIKKLIEQEEEEIKKLEQKTEEKK